MEVWLHSMENKSLATAVSHDNDTLTEKPTLVICSSTSRNMKLATPATIVKYIPGAKAGNTVSYLKLLLRISINIASLLFTLCGHDTWLRQSGVTKIYVESMCTYAKTMFDFVVYSWPLPNLTTICIATCHRSSQAVKVVSSKRYWLGRQLADFLGKTSSD